MSTNLLCRVFGHRSVLRGRDYAGLRFTKVLDHCVRCLQRVERGA